MKITFVAAIVNFIVTLAVTNTAASADASAAAPAASRNKFQASVLSESFVYHRRFLAKDINDTLDEVSAVMGSCLFVADHNNTPYNNTSQVSSCTEFHGDDFWNDDKMAEYCALKPNSTLIVEEECPFKHPLSFQFEFMVDWCYFEEVNDDNITMIEATPMITIPNSNCSDNQKECESVMEGIFKTSSACTTTSISSSNNITATTIYNNDNDNDNDSAGDSQVQLVEIAGYDGCDESKCVSSGLNGFFGTFDTPLTCYADDIIYPSVCSHGYLPRIVDTEPAVWSEEVKYGTTKIPPLLFHYFTCCQPDLPPTKSVNRHCSNSTILTNNETTNICEDDTARPYAQKMASYGSTQSFLCCDSVSNNNTISFLNDTECVPFINELFSPAIIINRYGYTPPITCDNINIYTDFKYPRKVEENNPYGIFHYKCCKTESTKLPPYIQDSTFKKTFYPAIIVSSIAVFLCVLLIVALLIPLFSNLKKKRDQTRDVITNTNTTTTTTTRRNNNTTVHSYGSYDLYLVYLAFPDLILCVSLLTLYGMMANQKNVTAYYHYFSPFIMICYTANVYINCFISYEILNLLRNSNNVARSSPPSLIKVSIQAMTAYLWSVIVSIASYFINRALFESYMNVNMERFNFLLKLSLSLRMSVSVVIPIMFFCYVWITIWYRGYIKLSSVTRQMKELVRVSFFTFIQSTIFSYFSLYKSHHQTCISSFLFCRYGTSFVSL